MRNVKIKKEDLLRILKENRSKHEAVFIKAQEGFKKKMIQLLEQRLADAKAGKNFNQFIQVSEPKNQTSDYDREIMMLELSVGDEIVLDMTEFAQYVQDDWSWKRQFLATSNMYAADAVLGSYGANALET